MVTSFCLPLASSEKISTIFRSDWLSASLNIYVPGASTFPGISNGPDISRRVSLFHSSAIAGVIAEPISAKAALNHHAPNFIFIFL